MYNYKKIPIWENTRRLDLLIRLRALVITYFRHAEKKWLETELIEDKTAGVTRVKINRILDEAHKIIEMAGLNPSVPRSLAPDVGGYVTCIDYVQDIFTLHRFHITPKNTLDFIDRAIGIYKNDRWRALIRTINPLFWLALGLDCLARLPFMLLGRLGFNQERAEESIPGKIVKGSLYVTIACALVLTALQSLGYVDWFRTS